MALTKFGIVYAVGSAQIRRYIYPTFDDSEIDNAAVMTGESITTCSRGPYISTAQWQTAVNTAVQNAAGKLPGNPTTCVIDAGGNVVSVVMCDPALDAASFPGMTLVGSTIGRIGWTWSVSSGMVAPPFVAPPVKVVS